MTEKTLVIVLSETRESGLTFDNFKKNVIDQLNADLCLCIGVKPNYDYNNPFYKLAKYKFTYDEPEDFASAFDYAYNDIIRNHPRYEIFTIFNSTISIESIEYRRKLEKKLYEIMSFVEKSHIDSNEFVYQSKKIQYQSSTNELWENELSTIENNLNNFVHEDDVIIFKKHLNWREFLKIKNQFLGGIKDKYNQHPGSAGILIFFRWFLLKQLIESDLINKYDRFIITRSDYIYQLPHPKLELMDNKYIWIPDSEHYGGITDRHAVLSKKNIHCYLDILTNITIRSIEYYTGMLYHNEWNLEQFIRYHLYKNNAFDSVKEFPYVMYSVRSPNGTTRWSTGEFSEKFGYYIKYMSEFNKSTYYKEEFNKYKSEECNLYYLNIDNFYKKFIKK
jgi:hypothetical protein